MKLNYTGRAIFHPRDHYYDMKNMYLYLPGCFLGGSWVFFRLIPGFSRVYQNYLDMILEYVTGVPRVFLGCFCPIEISWVAAMTSIHKSKPFLIKTS